MIRLGIAGLGKMGLSHLAIAGAHKDVAIAALCDDSRVLLDGVGRYSNARTFRKFTGMIEDGGLDAVIVATPPSVHAEMVAAALDAGIAVFCEKPFTLASRTSSALAATASRRGLANQVGYHNRYVASFAEVKRLLELDLLGPLSHARAEAYGPVVLRPQGGSWRSKPQLGGGCLYDYAAHPIDLLTWYFGVPARVGSSVRGRIFSRDADDEVYSTLFFANGLNAHLSVNWSDPSHRKMSTSVSLWGQHGTLYADRQELRVFLRRDPGIAGYQAGWTVRYTTELTPPVEFYLRGEEYSAQLDGFFASVATPSAASSSPFESAAQTDRVIEMIVADSQ
jgi:predicted dehydrogenase